MGDIVDFFAHQGFLPNAPYPDGQYLCNLTYGFPSGAKVKFGLGLTKVEAPDWEMTFADIADDLEALYYGALRFDAELGGVPNMDVQVHRLNQKSVMKTFLASEGSISFH